MNNQKRIMNKPTATTAFAIVITVITGLLFSCTPGSAPKSRKKFPEFSSFGDFNSSLSFSRQHENYAGLPFGGTEIDFFSHGKFSSYTYISMGDAQSDSLVMNLINTYKPLAIPMLSEWNRQFNQGVLIDFRPKPGSAYSSSEFNLESPGSFRFPVVFIYDGNSASRVSQFMSTMQNMSMLKATLISADQAITSKSGSMTCF